MNLALQALQSSQGQGNPLFQFVPIVAIVVIFYFLLIAPARKRQKKTQEMLDSLKNGDKVITSGGVYGTIVRAAEGEDPIRIRIATSVEIDVARSAITGFQSEPPKGS